MAVEFAGEERPVFVGLVSFFHIFFYLPDDIRVTGGDVLLFAGVFFQIV